ncbi:MAG: polymer-forming cytoskeletal protein [Thermoanaerobaculia bacterium]|nr:polymer-forming cytoskeletal protein [Thermoanaerobaculia bacterium]
MISAGTRIEGEISGATGVVIDGSLEGRVSVESRVDVGKTGQVRGEIRAESISVAGKVFGNIVGGDKVDIHPTGKLEGDVKAPRVSIADGAYFKGRVEMTGQVRSEASGEATSSTGPSKGAASRSDSDRSGSSGEKGTRPVDKPPIRPAPLDDAKASESTK